MSQLAQEVSDIQNSALGSVVLWKFCQGYEGSEEVERQRALLPLLFLVLPIIFHSDARTVLEGTRIVDLLNFAAKFSDPPKRLKNADVDGLRIAYGREELSVLNQRVTGFRTLTMKSLRTGIATGLLKLSTDTALVSSTSNAKLPAIESREIKEMLRNSVKFGKMCRKNELYEIANILLVRF